jgi:hypothetical protein
MNIRDILTYGQNQIFEAIEDLSAVDWTTPGICGEWSAKDIVAHLASYENVLLDVLKSLLGDEDTPHLHAFTTDENFDENEVIKRRNKSWIVVLAELALAHDEVMNLIDQIPASVLYQKGMLAWYGDDYYLEDFIVYTHYTHKHKHAAQIEAYKSSKSRVREVA